jgi:Tol biopolymer transport system component
LGGLLDWAMRVAVAPPAVVTGVPASRATVWRGWVAFSAGQGDGDIYLVKEGSPARRILGSDTDTVDQGCPAFSPNGSRLASGQATDDGSGGAKAALVITELNADGEPSDTSTLGLDGLTALPCPIWSADGRWLAFGAETDGGSPSQVWVVDTQTNDIRRLTGLPATDLEWSPITSDLFIAHDGISVYSTATDTARYLDGTLDAVAIAASPDGRSLAVQQRDTTGAGNGLFDLLLMGTDGTDQRLLASGYRVGLGIGPVWSPDGNRIAFQRSCDTYVDASGTDRACLEEHVGVVVVVNDHDPLGPSGTQTVIPPPQTFGGQTGRWFPYSVSWSPDSLTLLYVAWASTGGGVLAVPVDGATPPTILADALGVAGHGVEPWNTFQSWSPQP